MFALVSSFGVFRREAGSNDRTAGYLLGSRSATLHGVTMLADVADLTLTTGGEAH